MKVCWLIDADMFDAYRDELVTAIRRIGDDVSLVHAPQPPYRWDDASPSYRDSFPPNSCVITLGDIEFVMRIRQEKRWVPGAFATVENYFCSKYYCELGSFLLNSDYMMLPFGELSRCRDFLFRTFGANDSIFIRPDSPLKLFTGQTASLQTFDKDLEFMGFYEFPKESIVVVSTPKKIECEWRFVVAANSVVAGCQYKRHGKFEPAPTMEQSALELAKLIASNKFQPDAVWVLDICRTDDNDYRLLEIGGFSFADLYACDKTAIVEAVSRVTQSLWNNASSKS